MEAYAESRTPVPAHASAARPNILLAPHKALRSFMADTLVAVGRMDPADGRELEAALAQLRALLAVCSSHIELENRFMHPALEARRPGSSVRTAEDHVGHELAIEELGAEIAAVERACGADRAAAADRLYHRLALFVAENLVHMHVEETDNNAVLWACYGDEELVALEQTIVAAIPPQETMAFLRWMIPALDHAGRVELLRTMHARAPAAAFEGVLGIARARLAARDWAKLAAALGLPA